MKIMFFILCLSYGGAEKNLRIVADGMVQRGHEVVICNMNTLPTVQKFDNRVRIIDMPQFTSKGLKRFCQISWLKKLCKKENPDVLVSFLFMSNAIAAIAGKLAHIPVIVSERADPTQHTSKVEQLIYKCYELANGAVFQSEGAKKYFPKKFQEKSVVIPNPVILKDENLVVDYSKSTKSIAYSARFELKQKRQDIMLDAFKIVHEKHPEYVLDFYGDGPDEDQMKEYAKSLNVDHNVVFHGMSKTALQDISSSELFVLSSDYEGIPNSLLEALSIGLPCVSTDCSPGGARMLIQNEVNGLIVPCGDSINLAHAICRMIENREFAISCGQNALAVRERFSLNAILNLWEIYLNNVTKKRRKNEKTNSKIDFGS
jgi:glycosyltransferase involved in cell wall biosynthesis